MFKLKLKSRKNTKCVQGQSANDELECLEECNCYFKVALGVSPQFFSIWTRVLNHNKYVEIKQFSKEDIKQNNIYTVILLIKFLV